MFNIGPQELLLILVLALLVVGPERLPEIARTIGKGMRELRKAQDEVRKTIQINLDEPSTAKTRTPRQLPVDAPATSEATGSPDEVSEDDSTPASAVSGGDIAAPAAAAAAAATDPEPSGVTEMSRALGRTLAELRRARENVQRSFRDGEAPATPAPRSARSVATPPPPDRTSTTPGPESAAGGEAPSPNAEAPTDAARRDDLERPA
jgi:sec-independent protein translocase protein TatB